MNGSCYKSLDELPCKAPCDRYMSDTDLPHKKHVYEGYGGDDNSDAEAYFQECASDYRIPRCPGQKPSTEEPYEPTETSKSCKRCNPHINYGNYTVPGCQSYNSSPTYSAQIMENYSGVCKDCGSKQNKNNYILPNCQGYNWSPTYHTQQAQADVVENYTKQQEKTQCRCTSEVNCGSFINPMCQKYNSSPTYNAQLNRGE